MTQQAQQPLPGKLFGVYPQKQDGLYFQRIPIFGGQITALQLKQIAEIAAALTPGSPLHLTTRQSIELHHIREADIPAVQKKITDLGLLTRGAGGDSVRNITLCPCCEFNPDAWDVAPLARHLRQTLNGSELLENMPRKFKISLAGCDRPQSKPYISDLGFVAISAGTVRVIGAGSLGARPETGIVLYESLPIEQVAALTLAALQFFVDEGDRENRRKARFRHIRQRLGDEAFKQRLDEYLGCRPPNRQQGPMAFTRGRAGWDHRLRLQTLCGQLDTRSAVLLAEAAEQQDAQLRIDLHHGIEVFSRRPFIVPEPLGHLLDRPCIVACPGSSTCKNGLTDCPAIAARLSDQLKGNDDLRGRIIAVSGCPNNCAHSSIADIGLSGQLKTMDGRQQDVYKVTARGGNGATGKLGEAIDTIPAEALPEKITGYLSGLET